MVADSRFHRWCNPQRLVNAAEVVVHVVQSNRVTVILQLLEKPFVSRVKRRMDMRIVRFWRSTNEVLTWFGSGSPITVFISQPMQVAGL